MALEVGEVFEGKVTGITKFGAFVAMPDGKNGLVHISEIANTYVNDINEFVKEGQVVKVRVIGIGDGGKVNLSIKRLEAKQENRPQRRENAPRPARSAPTPPPAPKTADQLFEEKLKQFMSESDSKISSIRQYSDHRTRSRRR